MKRDIILAGVGGQGILSIAYCLCNAALKRGLNFKQAEVHGMAQRGGAVQSNLRISSDMIHSDLIPHGQADIVLAVEPMEALRYLHYLKPGGAVVSSIAPVTNIPDYPETDSLLKKISSHTPHVLVNSKPIASAAGSGRADNMVMLGAAAEHLGFELEEFDPFVRDLFIRKSEKVVDMNCLALRMGREAGAQYNEAFSNTADPAKALDSIDASSLKAAVA